ncbi:Histone acetyltransferase protein [Dioscorea alata]|uniref:Histone acetyltransferase protein n=1 Tax=Dioscorea alata TaxID=55571 RepID=A0ACB7WQX9_DIOAL|nr:Histone acetyltransferase protein [Dioscorea alata]
MHKLVFSSDTIPARVKVGYYVRGQVSLLWGYLADSGILCSCCNAVALYHVQISPSQFESHAGQAKRRKPYNHIFTLDGESLHDVAISLSKDRKLPTSDTDDLCNICEDGGDLLICDLCPRVFHKECVGLSEIPEGDWYCHRCKNLQPRGKRGGRKNNTRSTSEVADVESFEQRCGRVITEQGEYVGGCAICRGLEFSKSKKFSPRTVLICDQCEMEYHVGCLKKSNIVDLKELPKGEWFCCDDCSRIHNLLQTLLHVGPLPIVLADLNSFLQKQKDKGLSGLSANPNIKWRLLRGKDSSAETRILLSKALAIFHELFEPIVDKETSQDLIPKIVFGSSVVSAGILRVLGGQVAELPLIATRRESQGQGFLRLLFNAMERMLAVAKVKHFVIPATTEAESIWINKFGFSRVTTQELQGFTKGAQPMFFEGTSMLHKVWIMGFVSFLHLEISRNCIDTMLNSPF